MESNKSGTPHRSAGETATKTTAHAKAPPVPQHATPTFAPVSPLSDKDVHQVGRVAPRSAHSPAGSLTLEASGEPRAEGQAPTKR